MENKDFLNNSAEGPSETGDGRTGFSHTHRAAVDRRTDAAFSKAADALHKKHTELNRTFTLPFFLILACVIIAACAVRAFIAEPTRVDGRSMRYTLLDRERLFVEKVSYWFTEPERGDIVIVRYPDSNAIFVKRVIALPGETLEFKDGAVYIDGEKLDESAYAGDWYGHIWLDFSYYNLPYTSYTVPQGHYFVMGDNRNDSKDSRHPEVGAIEAGSILGKVRAVIWPLRSIRSAG